MRVFLPAVLMGSTLLLAGCVDEGRYHEGRPGYDRDLRAYHRSSYDGNRYESGGGRYHGHRDYRRDWDRAGRERVVVREVPRDRHGRPIWPPTW